MSTAASIPSTNQILMVPTVHHIEWFHIRSTYWLNGQILIDSKFYNLITLKWWPIVIKCKNKYPCNFQMTHHPAVTHTAFLTPTQILWKINLICLPANSFLHVVPTVNNYLRNTKWCLNHVPLTQCIPLMRRKKKYIKVISFTCTSMALVC